MEKCSLCNFYYATNTGGKFTRHLKNEHNITFEQYLIQTKYDGVAPKCQCGYCEIVPSLYQCDFRKFVPGHDRIKYLREAYVKKYGDPKCKECGLLVKWNGSRPRQYCSLKCSGKHAGFSLSKTQEKINTVIKNKYGCNRATQTEEIAKKISKAKIGKAGHPASDKQKQVTSERLKKLWQNPEYILFILERAVINKLSKLHQKIKTILKLDELGFKSEQKIGRYLIDEFNADKQIVIEINGNYPHANPKFFEANDIVVMPGNKFLACKKWASDKRKIDYLKSQGYKVLIIWESDDLEEKRKELMIIMETNK